MTEAITTQDVYDALKRVKTASGQPAVRALLQRVAGVISGSEVRPDQYAAVIAACRPTSFVNADGNIDDRAIYAAWNSAGKRAGR